MNNQKICKLVFLLIITASFVFSCKKDENVEEDISSSSNPTTTSYDTIFPLNYFPVFPGSYWEYVDSNNDTTIVRTDSSYIKDQYTYGSAAFVSDTFFVPFYNNVPIWGYEAHTGPISNSGSYPLTTILSESLPVGANWVISYWTGTQISRKIVAKDTTIITSTNSYYPTIVVEEYYSVGPPVYIWIKRRYYTKNIGLIREEIYDYPNATINTKELVGYFINN